MLIANRATIPSKFSSKCVFLANWVILPDACVNAYNGLPIVLLLAINLPCFDWVLSVIVIKVRLSFLMVDLVIRLLWSISQW